MFNIHQEIMDVLDRNIFMYAHEEIGHTLTDHVVSKSYLIERIRNKPYSPDGITMVTSFYSEEEALVLINEALLLEEKRIVEWRNHLDSSFLELNVDLHKVTGFGPCKEMKYKEMIPVHGVRIVLIQNDKNGRAFAIKTAYPVYVFEDVDCILEKIEE